MNSNQVRDLWNGLSEQGFRTKSKNPVWFKSVVVSMLLAPGNQNDIETRALEVVQELSLAKVTYPSVKRPWFHPSFHLGYERPRAHHESTKTPFKVGLNHSFDDLGVYCATHDRSWREYRSDGNPCTEFCRYGMYMA